MKAVTKVLPKAPSSIPTQGEILSNLGIVISKHF